MSPENRSDSMSGAQSTKLPMNCVRERGCHCCTSFAIVNVKGMNGLRWTAERESLIPSAVDIAFTENLFPGNVLIEKLALLGAAMNRLDGFIKYLSPWDSQCGRVLSFATSGKVTSEDEIQDCNY
ncbi:hypothetical protein EDD15DRAFT_2200808 [Pisolithus albus]|nr:hypothetical protein EDD15DRAFT_2200808 [Pisolithus albus]